VTGDVYLVDSATGGSIEFVWRCAVRHSCGTGYWLMQWLSPAVPVSLWAGVCLGHLSLLCSPGWEVSLPDVTCRVKA